jgi:hypothetical protein
MHTSEALLTRSGNPTTLLDVTMCVMAYKELESMGKEIWDDFNEAILLRRTALEVTPSLCRLSVEKAWDFLYQWIFSY